MACLSLPLVEIRASEWLCLRCVKDGGHAKYK